MRVTCLQLCTTEDIESNWASFEKWLTRAVEDGAEWVITPENTFYLGSQFHKISLAQTLDGPWVQRCCELAKQHGIHLTIGSIPEVTVGPSGEVNPNACYNTLISINPEGELAFTYRKVHLFDVDIPGGLTIKESDQVIPGEQLSVEPVGDFMVGSSICYDLRFGGFYQALVSQGANVLLIPAAFTKLTGEAHWHALLRSRAVEFQSWVLAPAQTGAHDAAGQRHSFGHTLIIDPWGRILADAGTEPGMVSADIQLDAVTSVRQSIPVQSHRKW